MGTNVVNDLLLVDDAKLIKIDTGSAMILLNP